VACQQLIEPLDLPLEFAMNALRLTEGVPLADWAAHTGQPEALLLARLHSAQEKGLLVEMPEKLRASPQGLLFLNELLALISEE